LWCFCIAFWILENLSSPADVAKLNSPTVSAPLGGKFDFIFELGALLGCAEDGAGVGGDGCAGGAICATCGSGSGSGVLTVFGVGLGFGFSTGFSIGFGFSTGFGFSIGLGGSTGFGGSGGVTTGSGGGGAGGAGGGGAGGVGAGGSGAAGGVKVFSAILTLFSSGIGFSSS